MPKKQKTRPPYPKPTADDSPMSLYKDLVQGILTQLYQLLDLIASEDPGAPINDLMLLIGQRFPEIVEYFTAAEDA